MPSSYDGTARVWSNEIVVHRTCSTSFHQRQSTPSLASQPKLKEFEEAREYYELELSWEKQDAVIT